jgi:hypothetical protein
MEKDTKYSPFLLRRGLGKASFRDKSEDKFGDLNEVKLKMEAA